MKRVSARTPFPTRAVAASVPLFALAALVFFPPAIARAADSEFARGSLSVGAHGGLALLAMRDVNDFLDTRNVVEMTRFDDLGIAAEGAVDVRYAIHDRVFLGIEAGYLAARSEDQGNGREVRVDGIPIVLVGGVSAETENEFGFRFLAGLGVIARGRIRQTGAPEEQGLGFLAQVGGEGEWRASRGFAVTAQGLARTAKVTNPGENFPFDLDFSGGSFRLGLRGYFGGGS